MGKFYAEPFLVPLATEVNLVETRWSYTGVMEYTIVFATNLSEFEETVSGYTGGASSAAVVATACLGGTKFRD